MRQTASGRDLPWHVSLDGDPRWQSHVPTCMPLAQPSPGVAFPSAPRESQPESEAAYPWGPAMPPKNKILSPEKWHKHPPGAHLEVLEELPNANVAP